MQPTDNPPEAGPPPPNTSADASQPAASNDRIYMFTNGGPSGWMETNSEAGGTTVEGTVTSDQANQWWEFPLRPTLNHTLTLATNENATAAIETELRNFNGASPVLRVELRVNGSVLGQASETLLNAGTRVLTFPVAGPIEGGANLSVAVCMCGQQTTVVERYFFWFDGSSWLQLPIVEPTYRPAGQT